MPVVIEQTFPLGRFQARRWNQPPFDAGSIEWPPSPWRLLRAIAARWFQYCLETGNDDTTCRDGILVKFGNNTPTFRLPTVNVASPELRQYQPTEVKFTKKKIEPEMKRPLKSLVPDRCQAIPPDEAVLWIWKEVALSPEEGNLLAKLLRRIHYFGRAESWTRFRLRDDGELLPEINCTISAKPLFGASPVLVNTSPDGLIERLLMATGDKGLANRPIPQGTAWHYSNVNESKPISIDQRRMLTKCDVQVVRFALDSTVLPQVTETLPVAEALRRALMSLHGRLTEKDGVRGRSDTLSGKNAGGEPFRDHSHAYYLPTDEDGDGRIDHLTLIARAGFDFSEMHAIRRLREVRPRNRDSGSHPLRVLMLGYGRFGDYRPPLLGPSCEWVSVTPYLATRYAKTRGSQRVDLRSPEERAIFLIENLREQIQDVRGDLGADAIAEVNIVPEADSHGVFHISNRYGFGSLRPIQFQRYRSKRGDDGGRRLAGSFRIVFSSPVNGPFCLGHSAHCGLGLFVPADLK